MRKIVGISCRECQQLLPAYCRDEAEVLATLRIKVHLPRCKVCRNEFIRCAANEFYDRIEVLRDRQQ